MKHEVVLLPNNGEFLCEDFGMKQETFDKLCKHLLLEMFQSILFKSPKRDTKSKTFVDFLDNVTEEELGFTPRTANDYLMLGFAFCNAQMRMGELSAALHKDDDPRELLAMLAEMTKMVEGSGRPRNPFGNVKTEKRSN